MVEKYKMLIASNMKETPLSKVKLQAYRAGAPSRRGSLKKRESDLNIIGKPNYTYMGLLIESNLQKAAAQNMVKFPLAKSLLSIDAHSCATSKGNPMQKMNILLKF